MRVPVAIVWDVDTVEYEAELNEVDLVGLLSQLDGESRTLVTVLSGEGHAACGGDARHGVVMYVTFDGDLFHQLSQKVSEDKDELWVVAGGQAGAYPAHCVVSIDAAAAALLWYADHGELLPAVRWESS